MSSTVNELSGDEFSSKDYISNMQNEKFKAFKSQDLEKGCFNVTFEVDGKILHAHKFILTIASEPMGAMLSDRWRTKEAPIKIGTYSYNNFYQFLCFIYSGSCKINRDNAFQLTDMAEYYGIYFLKELCDEALSVMEITVETIEKMYEHASLYSLPKLTTSIKNYILWHSKDLYLTKNFVVFKKPFVEFLSTLVRDPDYRIHRNFWGCTTIWGNPYGKESEFFEAVYKWAEHQVKKRQSIAHDNVNLQESIKAELSTILPNIKLTNMDIEFLMDFVVEKGFCLSATEFNIFFANYRAEQMSVQEETRFESIYELAKKQALKKQIMAHDDNFDLTKTIKADLAETIPLFKFYDMDIIFLMDFVIENGFFLSPTDLAQVYQHGSIDEEKCFKEIYKLAEMQALQKQKISLNDDFDVAKTIKADLAETIPHVKYHKMGKEFLMDFVVENGFLLSPTDFSQFYQSGHFTEGKRFKRTYKVAKKQALQKQKISSDDDFGLDDSIEDDLAEVIRQAKFYKMDKGFLNDFVVANGFITEEQASRVYDIYFQVTNNGQRICGVVEDNIEICRVIKNGKSLKARRITASAKLRFFDLKCPVPSIPSTVMKMKGIDWYLCLEKEDKVLTLKHYSLVKRSDYLLVAMEGDADFELDPNAMTLLTATCNNI